MTAKSHVGVGIKIGLIVGGGYMFYSFFTNQLHGYQKTQDSIEQISQMICPENTEDSEAPAEKWMIDKELMAEYYLCSLVPTTPIPPQHLHKTPIRAGFQFDETFNLINNEVYSLTRWFDTTKQSEKIAFYWFKPTNPSFKNKHIFFLPLLPKLSTNTQEDHKRLIEDLIGKISTFMKAPTTDESLSSNNS